MGLPIRTAEYVQHCSLTQFNTWIEISTCSIALKWLNHKEFFFCSYGLLFSPFLELFNSRQRQVLPTILKVDEVSDRRYELFMVAMSNGGGGSANLQLAAPGSVVACFEEWRNRFWVSQQCWQTRLELFNHESGAPTVKKLQRNEDKEISIEGGKPHYLRWSRSLYPRTAGAPWPLPVGAPKQLVVSSVSIPVKSGNDSSSSYKCCLVLPGQWRRLVLLT